MTGSCVDVWLSVCTQSSSWAVGWHQLQEHASSLSVIPFLLLAKSCWCFPKHVVNEASCMFTFKAGWGPAPDQTAAVYFRAWAKTMLLWQRLISDGWSLAGWGRSPSWSSTVTVYLLWHSDIWGIKLKIKWGTETASPGMKEQGLVPEVSLDEWCLKAGSSTEAVYKLCEKQCVFSAHFWTSKCQVM